MLMPLVLMVGLSLLTSDSGFSWQAYATLGKQIPLWSVTVASFMVSIATTLGHVLIAGLTAYGLSRYPGKLQPWVKLALAMSMMVPIQVNLVPLFFLMKTLHWIDTPWALVIPGWFGAFGMLFVAEWMDNIPQALDEAACLDGCTPLQTWWHIIMPLCKPALMTVGLLLFINTWNSFVWPLLMVVQNEGLKTLPLAIAGLKGSYREAIDWPVLMAACTVSTVPLVAIFAFSQKALMGGVIGGSVKE
jgi:multiple sugar transport system permease protein